ncbi:MAG: hypothetical protein ACI9V1_001417 [Spirosomataceae bacterium]|jgi:hypothetical protein
MKKILRPIVAMLLTTSAFSLSAQTPANNVANPTTNLANATGDNNTVVGKDAGKTITSGVSNVMVGSFAGGNAVNKSNNVIIGDSAGYLNDANRSILIGAKAGMNRNEGNDNIMIGFEAGWNNDKGEKNIYIGNSAGRDTNDGDDNVFIGDEAGKSNDNGENNIFIGSEAGKGTDDGNNNIFIGKSSGEVNNDGGNNTYLGYRSGVGSIDANRNVAIGDSAGASFAGTNSVAVGSLAGFGSTSASNNVFLGANARAVGPSAATLSNVATIGNNAMVTVENAIVLGDTTNPDIKIGIGTASPRHRLDVKGVINMRVAYNAPGLNVNDQEFIGIDQVGRVTLADFRMKYKSENDWADYVFASDYQLMPIQEVEKFIKINRHLPNVPSAEKVLKEGVNMTEITAKLLEKIEEQTLYIIDLQKQINELKKLIEKK